MVPNVIARLLTKQSRLPAGPALAEAPPPPPPADAFSVPPDRVRYLMAGPGSLPLSGALAEPLGDLLRQQEEKLLTRLQRMANLLLHDHTIHVRYGRRWAYNEANNTLIFPRINAVLRGRHYNVGSICVAVSRQRYGRPPDPATLAHPALLRLWHTLDAVRTVSLLTSYYKGSMPAVGRVFVCDAEELVRRSPFEQYIGMALLEFVHDAPAVRVKSEVTKLVQETRELLYEVTDVPEGYTPRFGDLSPELADKAAKAAEKIIREKIWPRLLALNPSAEKPVETGEDVYPTAPEAIFVAPLSTVVNVGHMPCKKSNEPLPSERQVEKRLRDIVGLAPAEKPKALRQLPMVKQKVAATSGGRPTGHGHLQSAATSAMPGGISYSHGTEVSRLFLDHKVLAGPYRQACERYRSAIDEVVASIGALFNEEQAVRYSGAYTSGRYDLRRAINAQFRAEATGVRDPKIFTRREHRPRRSVAFVACLDVSGSMSVGERITYLRNSMPVVLEPSRQLGLPMGILKYDDRVEILAEMETALDAGQCDTLVEKLKPGGNNNELLALTAAERMAENCTADEVYVLFVTDGGGDPGLPNAIKALQERDPRVRVVGIGIGPGCDEVPRLYKQHRLVKEIENLPQAFGDLLLEAKRGGLNEGKVS